jgi:hypothetical protein
MLRSLLHDESNDKNEPIFVRIRKRPFGFIIAFLLLIDFSLIIINISLWFIAAHQKLFIAADFTNTYTGFKMVLSGDGARLYDLALQTSYQQDIMGEVSFESGLLPYLSPPIIALFFSPLAKFSISTAFYIWTIGEFGLLIWLILRINRLFSNWTKNEHVIMTVCILAFWPLIHTFLLGQFSLFFLICILQMYIAMRNSKLGIAGLWLILLSIKPQTLLVPVAMTINKRYWRVAASAAIAGLGIVIFSSLFLGMGIWFQYIKVLPTMSSYFGRFGFLPNIQYTVRGILTNILGYSQASLINTISIAILIGGIVLVWLLWLQDIPVDNSRFKLYFAFTILISTFLSLHAYPHDDLVLVIPAAIFYDYLRQNDYPRKAYSVIILISPIVFFIAEFNDINIFGIIRPPIVLMVIVLIWIIKYMIRENKADQIAGLDHLAEGI